MPQKIPTDVKAAVIRDRESGKPRDTIARDNSVSAGAVSYIIEEWGSSLAEGDANALREFGIMLRKSGITASQCALGFRLASIMKDVGIDQDNFGHFISETYNQCGEIGLQPKHIAYNTKQILDLAGPMPLSQIPDYMQEKTTEKRKLEEDISKIAQEQLQAKATLEGALHKKNSTLVQLEQFSELKVELDKLHIPVEDIPRTVALIQGLRRNGYNVDTLALLVSNWEASGAMQAELEKRIADLTAAERDL